MLKLFQRRRPAAQTLESAKRDGYNEGLLEAMALLESNWQSPTDFDRGLTDTHTQATPERAAYTHHPLMTAAVDVLNALTLGTGVTYGVMDDTAAQIALEEWYDLNDLDTYVPLLLNQWLLDGELLVLLATNASPTRPAWLNAWDTQTAPVTLKTVAGNPRDVLGIAITDRTITPAGFAYRINRAVATSTEGLSPLAAAVKPACNYTRLLDLRLRAHEIRGRLNLIYYAFARGPEDLERRSRVLRRIPRDGSAVVLQRNPETGQSEGLDLLSTKTDAADAESDIRALVRTVAMVAGIPEHYLAIGDTGNRATAEAMTEPMVRRIERHQTFTLDLLTELFRKELTRRYGPARTYRQVITSAEGLTTLTRTEYVTAEDLEIPWALPPVRENAKTLDRIKYAHGTGLISDQTATEDLGYDPALEADRLAAQSGTTQPAPPPADPSGDPSGDQDEEDQS